MSQGPEEHDANTLETTYKVAICPGGNLLYKHIYFTNDQSLSNMVYWGI